MIEEIIKTVRKDDEGTRSCNCSCSCPDKTFSSGKKKAVNYAIKNNVCACYCPSQTAKSNMKGARDSDSDLGIAREIMEEMELVIDVDGEARVIES